MIATGSVAAPTEHSPEIYEARACLKVRSLCDLSSRLVTRLPIGTRLRILESQITSEGSQRLCVALVNEPKPLGWITARKGRLGASLIRPISDGGRMSLNGLLPFGAQPAPPSTSSSSVVIATPLKRLVNSVDAPSLEWLAAAMLSEKQRVQLQGLLPSHHTWQHGVKAVMKTRVMCRAWSSPSHAPSRPMQSEGQRLVQKEADEAGKDDDGDDSHVTQLAGTSGAGAAIGSGAAAGEIAGAANYSASPADWASAADGALVADDALAAGDGLVVDGGTGNVASPLQESGHRKLKESKEQQRLQQRGPPKKPQLTADGRKSAPLGGPIIAPVGIGGGGGGDPQTLAGSGRGPATAAKKRSPAEAGEHQQMAPSEEIRAEIRRLNGRAEEEEKAAMPLKPIEARVGEALFVNCISSDDKAKAIHNLMREWDSNRDGNISRMEFRTVCACVRCTAR